MLSPIIGLFTGRNFDSLGVSFLGVTLTYGAFVTSVINFIITAFVVFLLVRGANKLTEPKKSASPAAPTVKTCPYCKSEIDVAATRCPHCTSQL
jgi:large conductance mechanosensitive channel